MILDRSQQEIVAIKGEQALVLAGPGCGKTHILAQRIISAHCRDGVDFGDMACLTFTNRASREMNRRIVSELGYSPEGLFVGNIHRFCIRFLYDNALLPDDVSVMDEEDRDMWLSESLGLRRVIDRKQVIDTYILLFEQEHGFRKDLQRRLDFRPSETHVRAAVAYRDFKVENKLVDFDDVLLLAYDALSREYAGTLKHSDYHWLQVDEVQDLTPLQLAIIDLISGDCGFTSVYFGDEQQAIFEFIGAGGPALDKLKQRCAGHIYRLRRNYRSPSYLVELCNSFAAANLGIHPDDLPQSDEPSARHDGALQLLGASDYNLAYAVAAKVRAWLDGTDGERIAVLTRTNDEAEDLSALLSANGIGHTLVSRKDLFKQVTYKTVFAHFAVVANPMRITEWARLLYQMRAVRNLSEARSFVYALREVGATPADLMAGDGLSGMSRLVRHFEQGEIVVFDTETTGLDVFNDDIIQIAAVRYKNGSRVDDGGFEVLIKTEKALPAMLADGIVNPMVDVYKNGMPVSPGEAFEAFARYVGTAVLCGHNADFDRDILRNNYLRRTSMDVTASLNREVIDTLYVSKLLYPGLKSYKLQKLIEYLGIDAANSHNAADDVMATALLLETLFAAAREKDQRQNEFISSPMVRKVSLKINDIYRHMYNNMRDGLRTGNGCGLGEEMDRVYQDFVAKGVVNPVGRWREVVDFVSDVLSDCSAVGDGRRMLYAHLHELRTFNEGDLIASGNNGERVTVMTVHKAKGLEFENVILYNACERSYGRGVDSARVFYVAFSRAKCRLAVFYAGCLSMFVNSVARRFERVEDAEVEAMALIERLHKRR